MVEGVKGQKDVCVPRSDGFPKGAWGWDPGPLALHLEVRLGYGCQAALISQAAASEALHGVLIFFYVCVCVCVCVCVWLWPDLQLLWSLGLRLQTHLIQLSSSTCWLRGPRLRSLAPLSKFHGSVCLCMCMQVCVCRWAYAQTNQCVREMERVCTWKPKSAGFIFAMFDHNYFCINIKYLTVLMRFYVFKDLCPSEVLYGWDQLLHDFVAFPCVSVLWWCWDQFSIYEW